MLLHFIDEITLFFYIYILIYYCHLLLIQKTLMVLGVTAVGG